MQESELADADVIRMIQECIDNSVDGAGAETMHDEDIELCTRILAEGAARAQPAKQPVPQSPAAAIVSAAPGAIDRDDAAECDALQSWSASRFEIERVLGAGGFGIVFAARDRVTEQRVALKMLRPSLAPSLSLRRRFFREALTVRELNCEGIVKPIAVGLLENIPTIISELVDGPSLRSFLDSHEGRLPERQAIAIIAQVSRALRFMHERGVLHRDLKPANILLKSRTEELASPLPYEPMIADFGLAKLIDSKTLTNITGVNTQRIVGTLQYMAPEQARGARDEISTLSDLYSLAVILYECLVGVVPNRGKTYVEVLTCMLHSKVTPVRRIDPSLSQDIELVLQRALAREPRERYPSVADFGSDLESILLGEPIKARRPSTIHLLRGWAKRNPVLATLSTSLLGLLIFSCTTFGVLYYRERRAVARFKDLMDNTLESVRLHVEVAEDVLVNVPASSEQRYELHKSALDALESIARGLNYNRESLYRLSVQYSYLSQAATQAHRGEEALAMRRECLRLIDRLLVDEPDNMTYLYDQFYNRKVLVDNLANRPLPQYLALQETMLPPIQRLRSLAPENADYQDAEAAVLYGIGRLRLQGRLPRAQENLVSAVQISDSLFQKHPEKLLYSKYAIVGRAGLADLARTQRDLERSEDWCLQGIRLVESIEHPSKDEYWFLYIVREIYRSYAATLVSQRQWQECVPALTKCIAIEERLVEFDPGGVLFVIGKAEYLGELLRARRKLGITPAEDAKLLGEVEKQIETWKSLDATQAALPKLLAILQDPDAPPIEAGDGAVYPSQIWQ